MISGFNPMETSSWRISRMRRMRGQGWHMCENCGRRYHQSKNLKRHLRNECGKRPTYQCSYCPYKATYKSYLEIHMTKHGRHDFTPRVSCTNPYGQGSSDLI